MGILGAPCSVVTCLRPFVPICRSMRLRLSSFSLWFFVSNLTLHRFYKGSSVTLGVLLGRDGVICFTIEPPFQQNQPRISCIPTGEFVATRVISPKFGPTFDVEVPQRSLIRFHPGNSVDDSDGCILTVHSLQGFLGHSSRGAFLRFLLSLDGVQQFRLTVV